ncbi:hypothetical protein H7H82_21400 [Mycobacterium heidelbergense]|uniref:Uncharacterized protein n=1 Tax=Mycobacterium heidelbergense TaxID=53376 RepID=A0A1X0DQN0_MYCHE|nr:hypothetical protein [Mycobacterium heidelbergense]MCV7053112.1 hypothetical protein [Mycobacterium heidelbergense]ORA74665.1 hypothetical protein BST25_08835 [Mycobacterium heidelbergense]
MQAQLDDLQNHDSFAVGALKGLREEATNPGMILTMWREPIDYRAPIPQAPDRVVNPPWLGELKATGKRRKGKAGLEWRLYFSEPIETSNLVVACGLGWKDPAESAQEGTTRQQTSIRAAMGLFKRYCRESKQTYPPFEPR